MKKIFRVTLLFLIVMIPLKVKGYCSVEDKMRYTNLASNIVTSYDYVESNNSVKFSVTIHNVHPDLIIRDVVNDKTYRNNKTTLDNIVINNLNDGTNYSFEVTANNRDCSYRVFNTLYVTLPKYNKYYTDSACTGASDYLLCQKWAEIGNITHEQFVQSINDYKKVDAKEEVPVIQKEEDLLSQFGDFWAKYYLYILGGIIVICIPIIIIKSRKDRFDF